MEQRRLHWPNLIFVAAAHVLAVLAIVYLATVHFSGWTVALGIVWLVLCGVSISGGYHRLFAHPTYRASYALRVVYLLFGAASVQNSALKWSADHRRHHARTDQDEDPYNIQRGFWWAHIGWVFFETSREDQLRGVRDLDADPLIRLQHRYYVALALLVGAAIPACLGMLWGDVIGALLVAGFLRLVLQWHATFSVNSVAHLLGKQTFSLTHSGRDSFWTALMTFGEGYHNFHHRFPADYRNGVRWYHFDPTKWFVWILSTLRLTSALKRTPRHAIERARLTVLAQSAAR